MVAKEFAQTIILDMLVLMTDGASNRPPQRATLSMVAEVAGTSIPTVSKVLRGGTDVSPATRLRVMDAVRRVGYTRRASASPVVPPASESRPGMIDLVVNHVEGSWANSVLTGVERVASEADLDVVITLVRNGADWVSRLLRRPSAGAVVVLVDPTSSQVQALAAAHIPVVLIDPMTKPAVDALYTRVPRETRYKGKNFVETAVWRFGDFLVTSGVSGLGKLGAGFASLAGIGVAMSGLATWIAHRAGRSPDLQPEHAAPRRGTTTAP